MFWQTAPQRTLATLVPYGILWLSALLFSGCDVHTNNSLGDAYVAPAQLNLRSELSSKFNSVATLKHGEHVTIVDVRRRFVKIRSRGGSEGWVDSAQLLAPEQMKTLDAEGQKALNLPSQGAATVYEPLNVHIDANRQSPALARITEGESIAVLRHALTPKDAAPAKQPSLIVERPQPQRRRKERQPRSIQLPAPPAPPKPPENWQELSRERAGNGVSIAEKKAMKDAEATARKAEQSKKPVILEDWSQVRTKAGQSGWVLSRNLVMSIPDEVAQYAEGRRITSYFDLGVVQDEEKGPHHNWLWTTTSAQKPYDFDAWRVFLWNRHRHRYETSYRQRDLEGFYPVSVEPVDPGTYGRVFHLITKDDDEKLRRRTYLFDGVRVHLTQTEDYRPGSTEEAAAQKAVVDGTNKTGWFARFKAWLQTKFSRSSK